MILVLFRKEIIRFFDSLLKNYSDGRVYSFLSLFLLIACLFGTLYISDIITHTFRTVDEGEMFIFLSLPSLITFNLFLLSILFIMEIHYDSIFSKYSKEIERFIMGPKINVNR